MIPSCKIYKNGPILENLSLKSSSRYIKFNKTNRNEIEPCVVEREPSERAEVRAVPAGSAAIAARYSVITFSEAMIWIFPASGPNLH